MFAVFKNNKMITVTLNKNDDDNKYIEITEKERQKLYTDGYNRHILDSNNNIVFNPLSQSEIDLQNKQNRIDSIDIELRNLDLKTIRPIRENDDVYLNTLYLKIKQLRDERKTLTG